VRVGGDDGELRPWHYIYVYSIESRLIMPKHCPPCSENSAALIILLVDVTV